MATQSQAQVSISRIYLKDLSFESPDSPQVFRKELQPEIKVEASVRNKEIESSLHEVCLEVTVTGTYEGKNAFVVEVELGGLFQIQGVPPEHMNQVLRAYCPTQLFPYVRQVIDSAMTAGTFPPLILPGLNFES